MLIKDQFASVCDHTCLKPDATQIDIAKLCEEANSISAAAVCVNSYSCQRKIYYEQFWVRSWSATLEGIRQTLKEWKEIVWTRFM